MTILFLGDFIYDSDEILGNIEHLGEYIRRNEYVTILNLEAPLKSNKPINKWVNLYNSDRIYEVLILLNVRAVNLANNHIMDWGAKGLSKLISTLDTHKILHFGAGLNFNSSINPAILEHRGWKIGFLGFGWEEEMCVVAGSNSPGVAPLKESVIRTSIEKLKPNVDEIIVSFHWGYEFESYPLPIHRKLAQHTIKMGADLIIGHHPHIIQPYENYLGKKIYYSLGNFHFGGYQALFKNHEDPNIGEETKYGLGVLYSPDSRTQQVIGTLTEDSRTCFTWPQPIDDLSSISLAEYNKLFNRIRTTRNKPSLLIGGFHKRLNPVKLFFSRQKNKVLFNTKPILIKFGVYYTLRSVYRKLITS